MLRSAAAVTRAAVFALLAGAATGGATGPALPGDPPARPRASAGTAAVAAWPGAPEGALGLAQEKQKEPSSCCFTNPRYSGTCEVTPTAQETCASILDYLNNPMSQGKGYCGNTEIRGGWQGGACELK